MVFPPLMLRISLLPHTIAIVIQSESSGTSSAVNQESDAEEEDYNIDGSPACKKGKRQIKTEDEITTPLLFREAFVGREHSLRVTNFRIFLFSFVISSSVLILLTLLLFEAESESRSKKGDTIARHYRGGSGGAYEKWWKLDVGSVIGVVAPKVLKPWGVSWADA
jgi:hypothetical protein